MFLVVHAPLRAEEQPEIERLQCTALPIACAAFPKRRRIEKKRGRKSRGRKAEPGDKKARLSRSELQHIQAHAQQPASLQHRVTRSKSKAASLFPLVACHCPSHAITTRPQHSTTPSAPRLIQRATYQADPTERGTSLLRFNPFVGTISLPQATRGSRLPLHLLGRARAQPQQPPVGCPTRVLLKHRVPQSHQGFLFRARVRLSAALDVVAHG